MFGLKKKIKCPRCEKQNINIVKPDTFKEGLRQIALGPLALINRPKPLNVCKDCGFSWEDR